MDVPDHNIALDTALDRIVRVLTPTVHEWDQRTRLVEEHVQRLSRQLNSPHPICISAFGSSLSGLCLADSDIDLGLFGRFNGCLLDELRPHQQQALLKLVLKAIQQAKLARHKVQGIWGARVPVLKYTCALSGLDCDLSLQGTGALVKARVIQILNSSSRTLSALYRLVKLWAQAHDLNDASRSTFNSTSLLYMTIFYLQSRQLLPPLRQLVPAQLLRQPDERLLQGSNKELWEDERNLQVLLDAVGANAAAWQQHQRQQQHQLVPPLGELLQGFWQWWSRQLSDWVLDRNRSLHADLWHGTWTRGSFAKPYVFSLQDPFDASDCPARAVGSSTNSNGGTAAFIAYMFSSSSRVMQRYNDTCKHIQAETMQPQLDHTQLQRRASSGSGETQHGLQCELCKVLAWLFGPQAVLLLGSQHHQQLHHTDRVPRTHGPGGFDWAQHPFQPSLVAAVLQRQRQQQHHQVLTWLVQQLDAALEPGRNVLCLQHLGLLSKQSVAAATATRNLHKKMRDSASAAVVHPAVAAGQGHGATASALEEEAKAGDAAALAVVAAEPVQEPQQQQQQQQQYVVLLHGPPLPQADHELLQLRHCLEQELVQLSYKHMHQPSPKRQPKKVKESVQRIMREVLARLDLLEQQASSSSSRAHVRYGLMDVLQQHGFTPLLEQWAFIKDGALWERLLPAAEILGEPEESDAAAPAVANMPVQQPQPYRQPVMQASALEAQSPALSNSTDALPHANQQQLTSATVAGVASANVPAVTVTSGSCKRDLVLLKLIGKSCPAAGLKALYAGINTANVHVLSTAGGKKAHPAVAEALAAAAAQLRSWTWFSWENDMPGNNTADPSDSSAAAWYITAHLPSLQVVTYNGHTCEVQALLPKSSIREKLRVSGSLIEKTKEGTARVGARAALNWLEQQPGVVEAVTALLTGDQPQQQHSSSASLQAIQQQAVQQLRMPELDRGEQHRVVDVRVVKAPARAQQHAVAQSAAVAAAEAAATAALSGVHGHATAQQQQQIQQGISQQILPKRPLVEAGRPAAARTQMASVTEQLSGLSVQDAAASASERSDAEALQAAAAEAALALARAERAYHRRVRQLQDQIKAAQRKLQQKQHALQENEQVLCELQKEEQAALTAAGLSNPAAAGSSSSLLGDADGTMLLDLALQQSTEGMLKELRHDLNNTKCRVHQGRDAVKQLTVNLRQIEQEEATVTAAGVAAFLRQQQQPVLHRERLLQPPAQQQPAEVAQQQEQQQHADATKPRRVRRGRRYSAKAGAGQTSDNGTSGSMLVAIAESTVTHVQA